MCSPAFLSSSYEGLYDEGLFVFWGKQSPFARKGPCQPQVAGIWVMQDPFRHAPLVRQVTKYCKSYYLTSPEVCVLKCIHVVRTAHLSCSGNLFNARILDIFF